MRFVFGMVSLLCVLSCKELSRRNRHLASGFDMPSRHGPSERIKTHQLAISDLEERPSKRQRPRFKYDLGLGKNEPLGAKSQGDYKNLQQMEDQGQLLRDTDTVSLDVYEVCRFLVEHEATRMYPAPIDSNIANSTDSKGKRLANRYSANTAAKTASTKTFLSPVSNGKQMRKRHDIKSRKEKSKATSTIVTVESIRAVSERRNKRKHLAKVQPKRLLEDCLTILDHEKSGSNASAASEKSIIWSRPDTPQLDMNSVWVEMLLHNQLAISQRKG